MLDVGTLLREAAQGRFPPDDGGWDLARPWRDDVGAVLAFTGHAVVVPPSAVDHASLTHLGIGGFGSAHAPHVITALAGPGGWIDNLDVLQIRVPARAVHGERHATLVDRPDLADHPRARYARRLRDDVRVLGLADGSRALVTLGRGIGGLLEVGIETGGTGDPRALLAGAAELAGLAEPEQPLVAAVAPGNARALRTFLAAGYTPVGSVQIVVPRTPA